MILDAGLAGQFLLGGELEINRLGFGTLQLTGPGHWGEPKNVQEAKEVLKQAVAWGVNFIDTADSYGPDVAESLIASALHPYPSDLVIATKGGYTRQGPNKWEPLCRPEYLIQCVEMSLRRLRLDCIDLYQLHCVDPLVPLEDSLGALKEMQKQGKIRYIGLSNVSIEEIERAQKVAAIVSVQNEYNIQNRSEENVLRYCEKHQLAFIPWFPLASGQLQQSQQLAEAKGITPFQLAIAWMLHHSKVMIPIPGTSQKAHLAENIAAAAIQL